MKKILSEPFDKLRRLVQIFTNIFNSISTIYNIFLFKIFAIEYKFPPKFYGRIFLRNAGAFIVGKDVIIISSHRANPIGYARFTSLVVRKDGSLFIGDRVGISNSAIYCTREIIIENDVMIGNGCTIWDTDFHSIKLQYRSLSPDPDVRSSPVHIKRGAFIGGDVKILKGVTIGEESVIGAGSVVRSSVPDKQVWAGNPARFIKIINS